MGKPQWEMKRRAIKLRAKKESCQKWGVSTSAKGYEDSNENVIRHIEERKAIKKIKVI